MYLEKLEIQGFKSFAQKTAMEFPNYNALGNSKEKDDGLTLSKSGQKPNPGITAIVGPNGSGKSNIADAVRWVLGEQSIKLLRGKRSDDVIFSGSGKRARLGFAEAALYLNNEDKAAKIEYDQLIIKRRIYRNGESEYYINNSKTRLSDIQLLLAQANFGQRTYSVIGQGMIDAILSSTPQERKNFFDEATGVKQYQIKREQAISKMEKTEENLTQVSSLIKEIAPRLGSLKKQVEKLQKREELEKKLFDLRLAYYGNAWKEITGNLEKLRERKKEISEKHLSLTKKMSELNVKMQKIEKEQKSADVGEYDKIQQKYFNAMNKKNELAGKLSGLKRELEIIENRQESGRPADHEQLARAAEKHASFFNSFIESQTLGQFNALKEKAKLLKQELNRILRPDKKQDNSEQKKVQTIKEKISKTESEMADSEKQVRASQQLLDSLRKAESKATSSLFDIQKKYQAAQSEMNRVSSEKNKLDVELARVETKKNDMEEEIDRETAKELKEKIKNYSASRNNPSSAPEATRENISKIKSELEMIGAIDKQVGYEYKETKKRYDFLSEQVEDLKNALEKTKKALKSLDEIIEKEFNSSFENIQKGFKEYFSFIFKGGSASLNLSKQNELENMSEEAIEDLTKSEQEKLANQNKIGIEISASPPGKKVGSINMLSGGERALTSIALICAIIKSNPSPFVVLDEVDAALDEANSEKFAEILDRLARHTQFIAITHNRATMERAKILYGITMNDDGISKLLSVDLEKAEKAINRKL